MIQKAKHTSQNRRKERSITKFRKKISRPNWTARNFHYRLVWKRVHVSCAFLLRPTSYCTLGAVSHILCWSAGKRDMFECCYVVNRCTSNCSSMLPFNPHYTVGFSFSLKNISYWVVMLRRDRIQTSCELGNTSTRDTFVYHAHSPLSSKSVCLFHSDRYFLTACESCWRRNVDWETGSRCQPVYSFF